MRLKRIGIVGLGLMGGSAALALEKELPEATFIGFDHNMMHCKEAIERGIVSHCVENLAQLSDCDLIILAVPVDAIITILRSLEGLLSDETTVVDFGSTKAKISAAIPASIRRNVVTAHPMAGTEKFGPSAALEDLYTDKTVVICDIEKSGTHQRHVAEKLFTLLKMRCVYMDSEAHDRHAAYISHMPHAVSYALANTVMRQEDRESIVALAGGGFKDMSRIAKSNPAMWEDIFRQNKTHLLEAIYGFEKELKACRKMVENEAWEALNDWMQRANSLHDIL